MSTLSTESNRNLKLPFAQDKHPYCELIWRQQTLIVKQVKHPNQHLISLQHPDRLIACLQRSPITRVKLDPTLDETTLIRWAEACQQAGKTAFLRLPGAPHLPSKQAKVSWRLKCGFDRIAAALLLILCSPLLLGIAGLILLTSGRPILFSQWRVGDRGRLFQIFKFRTMIPGAAAQHHQLMQHQVGRLHKLEQDPRLTPLGYWLRCYSLDELPQLLNVLRGEMSLVGPRPWALYDALRVQGRQRQRLHALPGMTGLWQVQMRSHQRDLDTVNRCDLDYLKTWSPLQDFKILLLTIPKVLSRFGAY